MLIAPGLIPALSVIKENEGIDKVIDFNRNGNDLIEIINDDILGVEQPYDTIYIPKEEVYLAGEQNDAGYNIDVGNNLQRSQPIYPGEPANDLIPGRRRAGSLAPGENDDADFFYFSAAEGQTISGSVSSSESYSYEFYDAAGSNVGTSLTASVTGTYFFSIYANQGAGDADYTFSVNVGGQNDARSGGDAGNSIGSALAISPGSYSGYMSSTDTEDWYSFSANSGQGIFVAVDLAGTGKTQEKSDYDIHLYNPSGVLVHEALYYGGDELEYPADTSGTWSIQIDMFPGWDEELWPDDYFLYGSGAYEFELEVGGTAEAPIEPAPQPDITPIAQTFIINDDPNSNKDEYAYIAAIPAANYLENNKRYVSPIVYQGCDFIPAWTTTVDQTTQYLIDDWNTYLARHDMTASEYNVPNDNPIAAAAGIATSKWSSASKVVLTVDGSSFEDEINQVVSKKTTMRSTPDIITVKPEDLKDFGGTTSYPMLLGNQMGAIHLIGKGEDFSGDTGIITPRYEGVMEDWWPYPYDENGEDYDTFYPITEPGLWVPYVTSASGLDELEIVQIPGDRYTINIGDYDASIEVTIKTNEPSNLIVYLIDPNGNVRRPMIPHYNGGEINPLHYWNGGHWEHDQPEFRIMKIDAHDDFSVAVHNCMKGKWTAIVVPYLNVDNEAVGFNGEYEITANVRKYNPDRINAGLSAANAAVIASMNHAPLLFVEKNSVPTETSNAITQLGANNIIFVNINGVSDASPSGNVDEIKTMQAVIDEIKANSKSENYITITSYGTGEGYFAPSAMIAAYHVSPVLNFGEAKYAYNVLDMITAWREYAGDYYHGCRSVGHLPQLQEPLGMGLTENPSWLQLLLYYFLNDADGDGSPDKELPPIGLDLKLVWFTAVHDGIEDMIKGYGLDRDGREAYMFVGPRDTDIRDPIRRAMVGNLSCAGHIPVETPAFSTAMICRNILYPAIIHANPGKDVSTSQMMNYPDGYSWRANDGNEYPNYATRGIKESFSSHGRFYEGHCIWDNLLERYNTGALISYYSGHGTGGSGISAQYKNIAESFPLAEPRYEKHFDFDWWDSWRGYSSYDNSQTKTARWGGASSYNAQEPNLYDIIHFKYTDELFENLHSEFEFWSSCTTGEHWGPMVYLAHGSAIWYGAAGSTYGVQDDLHNDWIFHDMLVEGKTLGESDSEYIWLFNRDFTTGDPTTLYGRSTHFQPTSGGLTNVKVLYGDPLITIYNPKWIEPVPIAS
ncbi:MAG: hypothetical protein JSV67_01385 [Thermoplasmatales archaeon]|nr:MAG: hypothetical protein JSV67_01385 [Thermoplasmatales archaeon]